MLGEYELYSDFALEDVRPQSAIGPMIFWPALVLSAIIAFFFYREGYLWMAVGSVGLVLGVTTLVAPQVAFYLYFAWQSLDVLFVQAGELPVTPSKVMAFYILLLYAISIGKIRQRILVSKPVIFLMLMFGIFALSGAPFAIEPFRAVKNSMQIIVQVILVVGALHFLDDEKRIRSVFFWCFVGGIVAGVVLIAKAGFGGQYRARLTATRVAAQTTSVGFAVALIALAGLWGLKSQKRYLPLYLLGSLVIFVALMKTGARAGLIAVSVAFISGLVFAKGVKASVRIFVPVLIFIVLACGVFYVLSTNILDEQSQERLQALVTGRSEFTSGTSRPAIWARVVSTYLENKPLFGWGFANTSEAMILFRGEQKDIHNSFLAPLVDTGPVGFILFSSGMLILFLKMRRISDPRLGITAVTVYVYLVLSGLVHTIHSTKWFWIPLTMCLLLAEQAKRQELENGYLEHELVEPMIT